jgi:DNA-binding response OmpR family regulator
MPARILSISFNTELLRTRKMLVEHAGYDVTSVCDYQEAIERGKGDFDLVILGHSIPQPVKQNLISELRKVGCKAPVLGLLRPGDSPLPEMTRSIGADPSLFLATVREMLAPARAQAAPFPDSQKS